MRHSNYWAVILFTLFFTVSAEAAKKDELGCISGDCINGNGTLVEETQRGLRTYRGDFVNGKFHGFGCAGAVFEWCCNVASVCTLAPTH